MPLTSAHTEADHPATTAPDDGALITKAVMRAAHRLGLSNRSVAHIIGVSRPTVSRMAHGTFTLRPGDKPFELAVLLIRLFRSLDAIAGGDETARPGVAAIGQHRAGRAAAGPHPHHHRTPGRHCLPGRPPRCRLKQDPSPAPAGGWWRHSTGSPP